MYAAHLSRIKKSACGHRIGHRIGEQLELDRSSTHLADASRDTTVENNCTLPTGCHYWSKCTDVNNRTACDPWLHLGNLKFAPMM